MHENNDVGLRRQVTLYVLVDFSEVLLSPSSLSRHSLYDPLLALTSLKLHLLSQVSVVSDSGRRETAALVTEEHAYPPSPPVSSLCPPAPFSTPTADGATTRSSPEGRAVWSWTLIEKLKLLTPLTAGFEMELAFMTQFCY